MGERSSRIPDVRSVSDGRHQGAVHGESGTVVLDGFGFEFLEFGEFVFVQNGAETMVCARVNAVEKLQVAFAFGLGSDVAELCALFPMRFFQPTSPVLRPR